MVLVSLKYFLCILVLISYTEQQVEDRGAIDTLNVQVSNVPFLYKSSAFLYCDLYNETSISYHPTNYINSRIRLTNWTNVTFWRTSSLNPITFVKIQHDGSKYFLNELTNSLEVRDLRRDDIENHYFCNSTSSTKTIGFYKQVLPFLYVNDRESITASDGGSIQHECRVLFGFSNGSGINWIWEREGNVLLNNGSTIIENVNNLSNVSRLTINDIREDQRGVYRCTAINMYGNFSRTFIVRVKNHLSAVWPVLGILAQIVVLAVILFIHERRKKKNKDEKSTQ